MNANYPTSTAREALARRFGLPYSDEMQDWEWEIADARRIQEFADSYRSVALSDAERFSLMEILIQCVEDSREIEENWGRIEPLLNSNLQLHKSSIEYWSCPGVQTPEQLFAVSNYMRSLVGYL